ncbi:MAG: hypothetical protein EOP83_04845 [Verrucomicrobiaceae bacterium]|nr:MAG: hypothetical protein EOP83_04845 [Verrucomicrobiaceae bacterium]
MKTPPYLLAVAIACLSLSSCAQVASNLVSSMIDSAFDSDGDFEKNAVRSHLRHGDTVEEAQKAAFDDRFFMEMNRDRWLE